MKNLFRSNQAISVMSYRKIQIKTMIMINYCKKNRSLSEKISFSRKKYKFNRKINHRRIL